MDLTEGWTPVEVTRASGRGPVVLVCEHASPLIPPAFEGLGLSQEAARSHAAWDIGALHVAQALSAALDAPLVAGGVSRLIYDLNRPLEAHDAIPERSEIFDVPGNAGLDEAARRARFEAIHEPFHAALAGVLDGRETAALVTIHSFTPVYRGVRREVELGYLFHENGAMADAALLAERMQGRYRAALNQPYGPGDGVTYTLAKHGEARGLPSLMIEIRNDLVASRDTARAMAAHLFGAIEAGLEATAPSQAPSKVVSPRKAAE